MKIWIVLTQVGGGVVGIDGVFSTLEKADQAAHKVMEIIQKIHAKANPAIAWDWQSTATQLGKIYDCEEWDIIITPWNIDQLETMTQEGIIRY